MGRVTRCEGRIGTDRVSVRLVAPPHTAGPRPLGTVFVPPLIGGSGLQQIGYFRELGALGYRLATFDYRGHGKSTGTFCIAHTLEDARVAAEVILETVGGPLLGVADCYGCIPLLRLASDRPADFKGLALFNPIPSLQFVAGPGRILRDYFFPDGRPRLRNPFDALGMLAATNERLFPAVDKSRHHFGILHYDRARLSRAVREYLFLRPLDGVRVRVPTRIGYGRTDKVLGLGDPAAEESYRNLWTRYLDHADVRALEDVDHYWTGVHGLASRLAAEFFAGLEPARTRLTPRPRKQPVGRPGAPIQREPGEAPSRNHQLSGRITSSGL